MGLTSKEACLLVDVIDLHISGILSAKELTVEDGTVDTAEELLDLMAGYDDDLILLNSAKLKLKGICNGNANEE